MQYKTKWGWICFVGFSVTITKRDNFCLHVYTPSPFRNRLYLKEKNSLPRKQRLSFSSWTKWKREAKHLQSCHSCMCAHSPKVSHNYRCCVWHSYQLFKYFTKETIWLLKFSILGLYKLWVATKVDSWFLWKHKPEISQKMTSDFPKTKLHLNFIYFSFCT